MDYDTLAFAAIDQWMEQNHPEFYPNWPPVVPGDDVKGWGASGSAWRQDGKAIVRIFENKAEIDIDEKYVEIDKLRQKSLLVFRAYLKAKVEQSAIRANVAGLLA